MGEMREQAKDGTNHLDFGRNVMFWYRTFCASSIQFPEILLKSSLLNEYPPVLNAYKTTKCSAESYFAVLHLLPYG